MTAYLEPARLVEALTLRDLSDPAGGAHAMQRLVDELVAAVVAATGAAAVWRRDSPIVSERDNYDRLGIAADAPSRAPRYSRWLGRGVLLRTHTTAMIPPALDELARDPTWHDVLLVCPGLCYRRDQLDRLHVGEPHQLDLWRIRRGRPLCRADLHDLCDVVLGAALPGWRRRAEPAAHPYTVGGLELDVRSPDDPSWVEVGECGLAAPHLMGAEMTGLAMGLGLDRLLMLRKGLGDIRLLRARDPRIAAQMLDLAPYRPVSMQPPIVRDLSIAVEPDDDVETLGDRVRAALGARAELVEAVEIVSETAGEALPPAARTRLGLRPGQRNLLVRITLRAVDRTLDAAEGNRLRDAIYAAIHRGEAHQWAAASR